MTRADVRGLARQATPVALAAAALLGWGCGRGPAPAAGRPDAGVAGRTSWGETPLVQVGAGVVTREALERRFGALARENARLGRTPPDRGEVLEGLIDQELLVQAAVREGLLANDADVRDRLVAHLLVKRMREQRLPTPSSAELQRFFEEHRRLFPDEARYKLRQLLVAVPEHASPAVVAAARRRAEELRRQAAARPQGFAALAKAQSADPSARLGGETGYLALSRWAVLFGDDIVKVLPALKPGEVGPVVHSRRGFHVIQLLEATAAGADPLKTRQQEILAQYRRYAESRRKSDLVAALKREIPIVRLAPASAAPARPPAPAAAPASAAPARPTAPAAAPAPAPAPRAPAPAAAPRAPAPAPAPHAPAPAAPSGGR